MVLPTEAASQRVVVTVASDLRACAELSWVAVLPRWEVQRESRGGVRGE